MTRDEAMDALERVVSATRFPAARFYRIERLEDPWQVVRYQVYISSLETPCWNVAGGGRTLQDAVERALLEIPGTAKGQATDRSRAPGKPMDGGT
jgi:hypothetical protein